MSTGIFGRNVTLSFFAIIAVSFAVISAMGWQLRQTQQVVHRNSALIAQQAETRRQLVEGFKRADINLCRSTNKSRDVLADIIRGILRTTGGTGTGDDSRRAALVRLAPENCRRLPP